MCKLNQIYVGKRIYKLRVSKFNLNLIYIPVYVEFVITILIRLIKLFKLYKMCSN